MHQLMSSHLIKLLVGHVGGEHVLNLNRNLSVGLHDAAVLELDLDYKKSKNQSINTLSPV